MDAIVVNPNEEPYFDADWRMPEPREITTSCSSLVSITMGTRYRSEFADVEFGYKLKKESEREEKAEEEREERRKEGTTKGKKRKKRKNRKNNESNAKEKQDENIPQKKDEEEDEGDEGDEEDEEDVEDAELLQLAHFSVQEYLVSGALEGKFKTELQEIYARKTITQLCLAYIICVATEVKTEYPDISTERISKDLRMRIRRNVERDFPFAEYSACHWMHHANHPSVLEDMEIQIYRFVFHRTEAYRLSLVISRPWSIVGEFGLPSIELNLSESLSYIVMENGDAIIELLLDHIADVPEWKEVFGKALIAASWQGKCPLVRKLLANGVDVNYYSFECHHRCALLAACDKVQESVVRILLDYGADTYAVAWPCQTALDAVWWGKPSGSTNGKKIEQMLLKARSDAGRNTKGMNVSLIRLSEYGYEMGVRELLESGADANARGGECGTALIGAAKYAAVETVQTLLDAGADVNAEEEPHGSALVVASSFDYKQPLENLGVRADSDDSEDQDDVEGIPLFMDRYKTHHLEIIAILLDAGANINAKVGRHGPALVAASALGNEEIVKLLLRSGADVDAEGELGTALIAASVRGHCETAGILLDAGAKIDANGAGYADAASAASSNKQSEVLQLLEYSRTEGESSRWLEERIAAARGM